MAGLAFVNMAVPQSNNACTFRNYDKYVRITQRYGRRDGKTGENGYKI